jgi:hypothetical protein
MMTLDNGALTAAGAGQQRMAFSAKRTAVTTSVCRQRG